MPFVNKIDSAESRNDPSWADVKEELEALKRKPCSVLALYGKRNAQMVIEFVENHGYFISAFGPQESEERIARDENKPTKIVSVLISGDVNEVPACIFLDEELTLSVIHDFYELGERSQQCGWMKSIELY